MGYQLCSSLDWWSWRVQHINNSYIGIDITRKKFGNIPRAKRIKVVLFFDSLDSSMLRVIVHFTYQRQTTTASVSTDEDPIKVILSPARCSLLFSHHFTNPTSQLISTMKYSAALVALNLALVQVHGESKAAPSTEKRNRKLTQLTDSTLLLSFLEDSFYGRKTVINMLVEEYTNTTAKANCDKADLLDSAIEAIDFCETDGEPVPITDHDFLFVGSVGELVRDFHHVLICVTGLKTSSSRPRCIEKPCKHQEGGHHSYNQLVQYCKMSPLQGC